MFCLIGAGGHARVVADVARRAGHTEIVFFEDGSHDSVLTTGAAGTRPLAELSSNEPAMIAFGDLKKRREVRRQHPLAVEPLVDPHAVLGSGVRLGRGTVVMPGCIVNANATIGTDAILNTGCIVEHDCIVGDNSHLSPGVRLAGAAVVGEDVHVGTGAVVLPGVRIGDGAVVGAGAVVTRDVSAGTTVVGVPAKPVTG